MTSLNGAKGFVTGWGRCDITDRELCLPRGSIYYPDEKLDPMLRSVMFEIVMPNYFCDGYKRQDIILGPGMLCVGVAREENPVTPCLAVPGAPLVVQGSLAGLQSWGFGCGYSHDLPLVYTSVQYYEQWISNNVEVLNMLMTCNYTELFEVTKAYISYTWFKETRFVMPHINNAFPYEIQETEIDRVLYKIKGTYYDIRDFVDEGRYHKSKTTIVNNLLNKLEKHTMIKQMQPKMRKGLPFLSEFLPTDEHR